MSATCSFRERRRADKPPVIEASSIGTEPPGSLAIPARLVATVGSVREDTGGLTAEDRTIERGLNGADSMLGRVTRDQPVLRLASLEDVDAIDALMKASILAIFPRFYNEAQTAASVKYIGSVDRTLVEDGTYFVIEADGEIVACGGWSRRDKLYTGSGDAAGDARLLDPRRNRPECVRCSCEATGRDVALAPGYLRHASPPLERRIPHACARRHAARRAALSAVRVPRGPRRAGHHAGWHDGRGRRHGETDTSFPAGRDGGSVLGIPSASVCSGLCTGGDMGQAHLSE